VLNHVTVYLMCCPSGRAHAAGRSGYSIVKSTTVPSPVEATDKQIACIGWLFTCLQSTADGSPEYQELCNTLASCEPDKATQANLQQVILERAYNKTAVRGQCRVLRCPPACARLAPSHHVNQETLLPGDPNLS
jgi:hypothetical protein